jgi:hypothetical protein
MAEKSVTASKKLLFPGGKPRTKLRPLLSEFFGVGFFQVRKILHFPLDCGQLLEVRAFYQVPVGFAGNQTD